MRKEMEEALMEARVKLLKAKLDLAIEQRDRFITNCHRLLRMPNKEREEDIEDCNADLEKLNDLPFK